LRNILIIQGHPDSAGAHYGHALVRAYRDAAQRSGHPMQEIDVAAREFPLLRRKQEFEAGMPPDRILNAQGLIGRVEAPRNGARKKWLARMEALGSRAQ
jgi:putative NADPH-quinone reductase